MAKLADVLQRVEDTLCGVEDVRGNDKIIALQVVLETLPGRVLRDVQHAVLEARELPETLLRGWEKSRRDVGVGVGEIHALAIGRLQKWQNLGRGAARAGADL